MTCLFGAYTDSFQAQLSKLRNGFVALSELRALERTSTALDAEQHCGIGYRRKASRKNCKDDGECVSIC